MGGGVWVALPLSPVKYSSTFQPEQMMIVGEVGWLVGLRCLISFRVLFFVYFFQPLVDLVDLHKIVASATEVSVAASTSPIVHVVQYCLLHS